MRRMSSSLPDRASYLRITPLGWCAITLMVSLPWVALWYSRSMPATPAAKSAGPAFPNETAETGHPGPWGRLEFSRILIEPTEEFIQPMATQPRPLRWVFRGYSEATLEALWQRAGLTEEQRKILSTPTIREQQGDAMVLQPPADLVLGLSGPARTAIYIALASFPENGPQNDAYRIHASAAGQWLDPDLISPAIISLVRPLLYPLGPNMMFSDADLILPRLATQGERVRFIKNLSRRSALLVQLRVNAESDTAALARYWGHGWRSKDVEPFIESVAHRPQGGAIDIVHLLPPVARALLYTYPLPVENPDLSARDCHWTSLNFFKATPDDGFLKPERVQQALKEDYFPYSGELALGDIAILITPEGEAIHSCVYVADGIVFTKNGSSPSVPWMLTQMADVVSFYSLKGPLELRYYRRKIL